MGEFFGNLFRSVLEWMAANVAAVLAWFGDLFDNGLLWLLDQFPDIVIPDWFHQGSAAISAIMGAVGQMSPWFPTELFVPVLVLIFTVSLVGLGIRIARIVASFATLGGGA